MRRFLTILSAIGLLAWGALAAMPASASEVQGAVLTVAHRDGSRTELTLAQIEGLPRQVYATRTPWHDGIVRFEGVPLKALFEKLGLTGGEIVVEALNGYRTTFPVTDAYRLPVILAFKRDGQYMPVRDKGPLFIVYNYDSDPSLQSERYFARSAWQVRRMVEQ